MSLEPQTAADVTFYLRDAEKYVYQVRSTYEMILADYPGLLVIVGRVKRATGGSAMLQAHWISMKFQLVFGVVLTIILIKCRESVASMLFRFVSCKR